VLTWEGRKLSFQVRRPPSLRQSLASALERGAVGSVQSGEKAYVTRGLTVYPLKCTPRALSLYQDKCRLLQTFDNTHHRGRFPCTSGTRQQPVPSS
jgi:hypothetical protein